MKIQSLLRPVCTLTITILLTCSCLSKLTLAGTASEIESRDRLETKTLQPANLLERLCTLPNAVGERWVIMLTASSRTRDEQAAIEAKFGAVLLDDDVDSFSTQSNRTIEFGNQIDAKQFTQFVATATASAIIDLFLTPGLVDGVVSKQPDTVIRPVELAVSQIITRVTVDSTEMTQAEVEISNKLHESIMAKLRESGITMPNDSDLVRAARNIQSNALCSIGSEFLRIFVEPERYNSPSPEETLSDLVKTLDGQRRLTDHAASTNKQIDFN